MRFGLHLTHYLEKGAVDPAVEVAQQAEAIGFSSVWAGDHILSPEYVNTTYPHADANARRTVQAPGGMPDPFVLLAVIGGRTSRIKLGFNVLIVPYRPPLVMAKQIATLDSFTNGRVIVGVGAGWHEQEFAALGMPFKTRGSRTDETIEIWRMVWTGDNVSHQGRHFQFDSLSMLPIPAQAGGPPIYVGGDGPRARERVSRYGDGWMPTMRAVQRRKELFEEIAAQSEANGRRRPQMIAVNKVNLTDTPQPPHEGTYGSISGTPDQIIAILREYEAAGIDEVIVSRQNEDPAGLAQLLQVFEREVMPAFR